MLISRICKRTLCSSPAQPWLFVGLGNPGDKFRGTRYNVGFEMIDALAESLGISVNQPHCKALFGQGYIDEVPIFLAKPQTYMNLIGESVGPLAAYYKLPLNRVVVFHDDMGLSCGVLRFQQKGGHGSHNGIQKNYISSLAHGEECVVTVEERDTSFSRDQRISSPKNWPPGQMDHKAFLLQKFNVVAQERVNDALEDGVNGVKLLATKGFTASGCFNRDQKYKYLRIPTMSD